MRIGGLQKLTLLDYPGKVACTVFLSGCNLRCPYCHNPGLVLPEQSERSEIPEAEVLSFLERRKGKLDGVCITGGEPTLQPELPEFLEKLRRLGYAVKLDTNGTNPAMLKALLQERVLDYVAMDIKNREFSDRMAHNLQEHGVKLAFGEKVVRLEGKRRVERVVTDQGCYEADMVVFGIGFRPNTSLGQGRLRTFGNGAFLVDRRQETSVPGVYAVGDCATVYNNAIQAADYIALATNAVRSGIIAAHNACGKVLESVGVQGSNGISIWGLHMLSTGISLARAKRMGYDAAAADYEDWQKAEFMENGNHKVKIRIVYDRKSRIILGAQMCSDYDVSMGIHMFSMAVEEQVTIDKLKLFDLFFLPHFNKPYNYVTMAALGAE